MRLRFSNDTSESGCLRLWGAVIRTAAKDVGKGDIKLRPTPREKYEDEEQHLDAKVRARKAYKRRLVNRKRDAAYFNSRSFRQICGMIGLDPDYIVARFRADGFRL